MSTSRIEPQKSSDSSDLGRIAIYEFGLGGPTPVGSLVRDASIEQATFPPHTSMLLPPHSHLRRNRGQRRFRSLRLTITACARACRSVFNRILLARPNSPLQRHLSRRVERKVIVPILAPAQSATGRRSSAAITVVNFPRPLPSQARRYGRLFARFRKIVAWLET
jgi:hypothetical protein